MTNEQILRKALEKAVKNGFRIKNLDYNNNKEMSYFCDMVISDNLYNLIFFHSFAKALNFKLKDLGAWCDEGKEPLKFIERLI